MAGSDHLHNTEPDWLEDHVCTPHVDGTPDIKRSSDSYCTECMYWNPAFGGPSRYEIDPNIEIEAPPKSAPYVDQQIDNVWITSDFFKQCGYFGDMPEEVVTYAIQMASWLLHIKSGRQFPGLTKRIYQPGCAEDKCFDCCEPDTLVLPGPINQIDFVVNNGQIIDGSNYRIMDNKKVINVDCAPWPTCQNFCRSPFSQWPIVQDGNQHLHEENNNLDFFDQIALEMGALQPKHDDWIEEYIARNPVAVRKVRKTLLKKTEYKLLNGSCDMCASTGECDGTPCPPGAFHANKAGTEHLIYEPRADGDWKSVWLRYGMGDDIWDGSQDSSDWPWWVRKYIDPTYHQPKALPLPSSEYEDWVNKALGGSSEQQLVEDWIASSLENDKFVAPGEYKCSVVRRQEDSSYNEASNWNSYVQGHSCGDDPAWAIVYYQGFCPPMHGQFAAAELAREIAESICKGKCLPSHLIRLERDGVDAKFFDLNKMIESGRTGLSSVDTFLQTVNPHGLQRRGYVVCPSSKHRKMHTVRPGKNC